MERRVGKHVTGVAKPIAELRWPLRPLAVRVARRMLRRNPVEGLVGINHKGESQWAPGYPDALYRE